MAQQKTPNYASKLNDIPFYPTAHSEDLLGHLDNSLNSEIGSFQKRRSEKDDSGVMEYDHHNPFAPMANLTAKSSQPFTPPRYISTDSGSVRTTGNSIRIGEATMDSAWKATKFAGRYTIKLAINTLLYLHKPLSLFLCFYFLTLMAGYISQSLYQTISPICVFPGFSNFSVCRHVCQLSEESVAPKQSVFSENSIASRSADFSALMDVQTASFEQLLQELAGGSGISLEIKKAEMAVADLVVSIRASDLKARDSLARTLSGFVFDSKKTARGLQRLTSKVGGAVDKSVVHISSLRLHRSLTVN